MTVIASNWKTSRDPNFQAKPLQSPRQSSLDPRGGSVMTHDLLSSHAVPVVEFVARMNRLGREYSFHFCCHSSSTTKPMDCAFATDHNPRTSARNASVSTLPKEIEREHHVAIRTNTDSTLEREPAMHHHK